ncbi:MAG: TfoX/Sxy family protein [Planctomycetes bacterium]|nr:TfoX/Sxy family protein [Planctomycetota bacterium]
MFGGRLPVDGGICALTMRGRLFFKVDDTNRPQFESEGMEAFQPFPDRPGVSYASCLASSRRDVEQEPGSTNPWTLAPCAASAPRPGLPRTRRSPSSRISARGGLSATGPREETFAWDGATFALVRAAGSGPR